MNTFEHSFFDELEKIAVSIKALERGFSRIGVVSPRKGTVANLFQAFTVPTKRQAKAVVKIGKEPEWQAMVPSYLKKSLKGYMRRSPGRIYVAKDIGKTLKPSATKKEVKDVQTLFGIHESLERRIKPKQIEYTSLHLSPKVLIEETNLLNRLKGGEGAKKFLRGLREAGEAPKLREQFEQAFGPRGLKFLEKGERVPKAMKKRFMAVGGRKDISLQDAMNIQGKQQGFLEAFKNQPPLPT